MQSEDPSSADALDDLSRLEGECDLEFTRASGPGGQRRNKVETAVRLTHRPTGVVVVASDSRSQAQNRKIALQRLAAKLRELQEQKETKRRRQARKPTKPTAAARERRLEAKRKRARKKELRRRISAPTDD